MVLGGRLTFKPKKTKTGKYKNRKCKNDPELWNPEHPVQRAYDRMISQLIIPEGWRMWGSYFRWVKTEEYSRCLLRVQRIGRKKPEGGYETHAVLFLDAVPYVENTAGFFLEVMNETEQTEPENIPELAGRERSWFQKLKRKAEEERAVLKSLGLALSSDISEICTVYVQNLSRQFFQSSPLPVKPWNDIATQHRLIIQPENGIFDA